MSKKIKGGGNKMATLNNEKILERRKKVRKIFLILLIVEFILSIFLVDIIDQLLTMIGNHTLNLDLLDMSLKRAFVNLFLSNKHKVLLIATQLIYLSVWLYAMTTAKSQITNVDTRFLTDDIETPVPAGNGQHGNERFLTKSEKDQVFQVFEYSGVERVSGKAGIVVHMEKRKEKEYIYYIGKDLHSLIIGASGSGKTRRILFETIWLQILSGLSVVVSDVKGEIYYFTKTFAEANGYNTIAIDLRNPKKSAHYNFLQPVLDAFAENDEAKAIDYTWDLVSVLVGEQKGEPLWYNGETATIAAAILIIALDAPSEYKNFTNVYYFLAYMCESDEFGDMPINKYLENLSDTHPAKGVFAMAKIAADKTRSSFFTSALGTLRLFTNPNVADMTSKSDFKLKDISKNKTIVYLIIPDEKKTLYPLVSILITQLYSQQVELANENGLRLPIDTDYDLDEVGNFPVIPVLGNILSAGRSRGVRANLIIQDFQQLESKYKDDFKNIKTNCQVKIYLKSDDPDTLKWVSENIGKYTVEVSSASTSSSEGTKNNSNFSSSSSLVGRSLLEASEVGRIKSPYSICMLTGEYAAINNLPDLSQYKLNTLYGLGNETHNTKIMMERESKREERFISPVKLWGIWNKYKNNEKTEFLEQEKSDSKTERISFL